MRKKIFLIFAFFICNYNLVSQEIDANATTTSISFTNEEGYTTQTHVNALSDFVATSSSTGRQVISNGGVGSSYHRITVKTQYQRHQKNLPFTGASGDILSPKKAQASSPSDPGSSFRVNSGALEKIIDQQNEDMYEGIGDMYD